MTDKLQPLDNNYIAVLKNIYKRWLNLEIFKNEGFPSKFDKIKKISEIMYSIRPEVGKYCWDVTIFKGEEGLEEPEEMVDSQIEIEEENLLNFGIPKKEGQGSIENRDFFHWQKTAIKKF